MGRALLTPKSNVTANLQSRAAEAIDLVDLAIFGLEQSLHHLGESVARSREAGGVRDRACALGRGRIDTRGLYPRTRHIDLKLHFI